MQDFRIATSKIEFNGILRYNEAWIGTPKVDVPLICSHI